MCSGARGLAKSGSVGTLAGISVEISVKDFAGCPRALTELSPGKVASRRSALSRPSLMGDRRLVAKNCRLASIGKHPG